MRVRQKFALLAEPKLDEITEMVSAECWSFSRSGVALALVTPLIYRRFSVVKQRDTAAFSPDALMGAEEVEGGERENLLSTARGLRDVKM